MEKAPARRRRPAGVTTLPPRRKWQAITLATLLLVPAYWFLLAGVVSAASDGGGGQVSGPFIAFGLALIPFVFVVLAFTSGQPNAPRAVLRAMGMALLVGIPVSAIAPDAVTGLVAGMGAGGIVALRSDESHTWRSRALAVLVCSMWVLVTIRVVPQIALLLAPVLPFTGIGVADHLSERRADA
jgi:hypothetical protein